MAKVGTVIKKNFVSGLLVTVPLIVTYFVLRFLFDALDGLLNPVVHDLLGYDIPGLGAVMTLLLILLTGIIATNFIGARLFHHGDRILGRMPLVRIIYTAAKQLVDSVLAPKERAFSEVVMVEYPRRGLFAIGFLSNRIQLDQEPTNKEMAMVFIPSTPTPISGLVIVVPITDIHPLDISVEEAIKILVSGGITAPKLMKFKNTPLNHEVTDASG
jgi:uncharacterized membrane protein